MEILQGLIVKKLTDYLAETEQDQQQPIKGDTFAFELQDGTLLETYVMGQSKDGDILLDSNEQIFSLLESWGYISDDISDDVETHEEITENYDYQQEQSQDPGEYDQEGDMAKNELHTIVRAARKLAGMLDNNDNMPEWTQKKITKAADYVDTAADYISSQKERGVMEQSEEDSPVARAILHRIMMQHTGMLAQYGPEKVMAAVDDVADLVGDVDEIGTSDVSGWVNMVQEILDSLDQGVAEGHADQQRKIFKKNGQPVGEVGIDRESSPGVGQYYMKHYASGKDLSGFDSFEEAVQELRHLTKQGVAEGSLNEAATMASVSKLLRHIERHNPTWFDDYGMGEVEDTVVDMAKQGTFSGMTVVDAAALVGQELESLYGADGMNEAEYQGRKVPLGKPMRGDVAKSKVYVRDPKTGNIKKVNFGDPNMKIKKSNPARRKSFRARHNCDNPGPRTKARYWSCRAW